MGNLLGCRQRGPKITAVGAALAVHLGVLRAPRPLPSPIVVAH
ncbi:hypothetical protein AB0N09_07030 [Streptomyces erythrochromogenes]